MALHYTKTTWVNDTEPAINATNLNKIETGIETAFDELNERVQTVNGEGPDADGNVELHTLPSGGTAGQTIIKQSATEGDAIWADLNATDVALGSGTMETLAGSIATIEKSPATANHAVGEYIVYNGQLYLVTTAITAGTSLTGKITAKTVGGEIASLKVYVVTNTGTTLTNYTEQGIYWFSASVTPTDIPMGVNGWLVVIPSTTGWIKQFWIRAGTPDSNDFHMWTRMCNGSSVWSSWTRIITEAQVSEAWSTATLNSTYITGGTISYLKIGKLVIVRCMDILVSTAIPTGLTQLASGLPRAESTTAFVLSRYNNGTAFRVAVTTSGNLNAHYPSAEVAASTYQWYGSIVYRASE